MRWISGIASLLVVLLGPAAQVASASEPVSTRPTGLDGTAPTSAEVAGYPVELHGTWLPPDISCATLDAAGSDALVVIEGGRLLGYEDTHFIRSVDRLADVPAAWLIRSALSLGGDTPDDRQRLRPDRHGRTRHRRRRQCDCLQEVPIGSRPCRMHLEPTESASWVALTRGRSS